jgi:hypothetical protein
VQWVTIEQRDIQALGGRKAKYPTAYIVARALRPLNVKSVLETTYGEGRFYVLFRPPYLVGVDIVKHRWLTYPDEFYLMSVWEFYNMVRKGGFAPRMRIDAVVCDPPWGKAQRRSHYTRNAPGAIIHYSVKAAELLSARYFLLHYHRVLNLDNLEIAKVIEFVPFTRYLNTKYTRTYFVLYENSGRGSSGGASPPAFGNGV